MKENYAKGKEVCRVLVKNAQMMKNIDNAIEKMVVPI